MTIFRIKALERLLRFFANKARAERQSKPRVRVQLSGVETVEMEFGFGTERHAA